MDTICLRWYGTVWYGTSEKVLIVLQDEGRETLSPEQTVAVLSLQLHLPKYGAWRGIPEQRDSNEYRD